VKGAFMKRIKREFYDPQGAADLIGISLSDLWHLIEIGEIGLSIRRNYVDSNIHLGDKITIGDYMAAMHTFDLPRDCAAMIAAKGGASTKEAYLLLAQPKEIKAIDSGTGEEIIFLTNSENIVLDREVEITRDDVVITQFHISKYLNGIAKLDELRTGISEPESKPESTRKTENLLQALTCIAIDAYGYDPKSAKSTAPKDIADALSKLGRTVDPKTIRGWLKDGADLLPRMSHKS
jgi:hypothetical protein